MEKQYIAQQTKSFTDGQVLADIIKGRKYTADRENEWFIDEFDEKRYLPKAEFDEYFAEIRQKAYKVKAKMRYATSGKNYPLYIVLFPHKDQDIIDRLEEMKETAEQKRESKGGRNGKSDYIRRLIREDIARNKEAFMTSSIGDLPINSKGLRTAIDYISKQKQKIKEIEKERDCYLDDRFAVCHALRMSEAKNQELQKKIDELNAKIQ